MADFALKGLAIATKLIESRIREQVLYDLKESDVMGQHFRDAFVIKELQAVKEKLDALSRVDLLASLNFFEDGITLLHGHLDRDSSKELSVLGLTTPSDSPDDSSRDQTDDAFIVEAKDKFDKAIECAVKAVSNDALKLQDRILASRLRIIGTILKHIDECEISLTLCKSYVNQVNSIPEVLNNMKVHFGKGLKKKLYSDERNDLVWSVISINRLMWSYAHACKADSTYFADWPLLNLDEDVKLHPILDGAVREMYSWLLGERLTSGSFVVADTQNGCIQFSSSGNEIFDNRSIFRSAAAGGSFGITIHTFMPRCIAVSDNFTIFSGSSRGTRDDPPTEIAEIQVFDDTAKFVKCFGGGDIDFFGAKSILTSMLVDSQNARILVSDDGLCCVHAFNLDGKFLTKVCEWGPHEGY